MNGFNILEIFLLSLTLTIVAGSGSVQKDFDTLIQKSFEVINATGVFTKKNFVGIYGNGNGYAYDYQIDQIITLVAKGTNRLTGIDANFIIEVLNGRNPPPFQKQLSCIKDGLQEMRNVVINERQTSQYFRNNFKRLNISTKTCEDFLVDVVPHYKRLNDIYIPEVLRFREFIPIFDSLNMLDLFVDYWNGKIKADLDSIGIITADIAQVDQQEGINYVNGISKELSYPLSCMRDILDQGSAGLVAGYQLVLAECRK